MQSLFNDHLPQKKEINFDLISNEQIHLIQNEINNKTDKGSKSELSKTPYTKCLDLLFHIQN